MRNKHFNQSDSGVRFDIAKVLLVAVVKLFRRQLHMHRPAVNNGVILFLCLFKKYDVRAMTFLKNSNSLKKISQATTGIQ